MDSLPLSVPTWLESSRVSRSLPGDLEASLLWEWGRGPRSSFVVSVGIRSALEMWREKLGEPGLKC